MVKSKTLVKNIIMQYVEELEKHVAVEKVILFGSWAKGNCDEYSDIDLAIFSSDFGKQRLKEAELLYRVAWIIDNSIEAIPYSTDDIFTDVPTCFVNCIIKDGEVVYSKSKQ